MTVILHNGRKEIIAFLGPYLDLPPNPDSAWQKVTRWKKAYGLPIERKPNGTPFLDESVFRSYWIRFRKKRIK